MKDQNSYNIFTMAQSQFDAAADKLELNPATRDLLRLPMREYQFAVPLHLDNTDTVVMRGFSVQYNSARGPTKGGVRFHPQQTIDTNRALAMWKTWKCAVTNLPLGGSSCGVACDPNQLSATELERVCRGLVRQIAHISGPDLDALGPDIMTGPQQLLWMLDEYETIIGRKKPGFISGKPLNQGGSHGRIEASGYAVMISVREALKDLGIDINETTASIQGFGNVGQYAAKLYEQMGGKVVCISCWNHQDRTAYAFRKMDGMDVKAIRAVTNTFGEIDRQKAEELGCECLPGDEWLEQDVDILVPAALEYQIRKDNAHKISDRVKVVAEGASGPTAPEVDPVLQQRDILIIPDILAGAGGAVSSYFEQVQSNMNYFWGREEVFGKLDNQMTDSYLDTSSFAKKHSLSLRDAAYLIAVDRVAKDCEGRGWV